MQQDTIYNNIFYWSCIENKDIETIKHDFLNKANISDSEFIGFTKMNGYLLFTCCNQDGFLLYFPRYNRTEPHNIECHIDWSDIIKNCNTAWPIGEIMMPTNSSIHCCRPDEDESIIVPHIRLKEFHYEHKISGNSIM